MSARSRSRRTSSTPTVRPVRLVSRPMPFRLWWSRIVWGGAVLSAGLLLAIHFLMLKEADSAVQEASASAMVAAWLIAVYVGCRGLTEILRTIRA